MDVDALPLSASLDSQVSMSSPLSTSVQRSASILKANSMPMYFT